MELYNELRENWERLYWDEGYSKKLGQEHANYDSAEDDDEDFSPYRRSKSYTEHIKDQGSFRNRQDDSWGKVQLIRDKFEYDRERRTRERAFAPVNEAFNVSKDHTAASLKNQPFDSRRYLSDSDSD